MAHLIKQIGIMWPHREGSSEHGAYRGLHQVLCILLWLLAVVFCGTPNSGNGVSMTISPTLETLFFLLGCLVHLR